MVIPVQVVLVLYQRQVVKLLPLILLNDLADLRGHNIFMVVMQKQFADAVGILIIYVYHLAVIVIMRIDYMV